MRRVSSVLLLLAATTVTDATIRYSADTSLTLYVMVNGSDSNSGADPSDALRSVSAAIHLLGNQTWASADVQVGPGMYGLQETLTIGKLGDGGLLTLRALNSDAPPTISGGDLVSLSLVGDVYEAVLPFGVGPAVGDPLTETWARVSSESGGGYQRRFMNNLTNATYQRYVSFDVSLTPPRFQVQPGDAAMIAKANLTSAFAYVYHSWTSSLATVSGFNESTSELFFSSAMPDNVFNSATGLRYRLVNVYLPSEPHKGLQPGGFHYDSSSRRLLYRPAFESEVEGGVVELMLPRLPCVLSLEGAANVVIQDVTVSFSSSDVAASCLASSCDGQSASALQQAAVMVSDSNNIAFNGLRTEHVGGFAFWLFGGSYKVVIENSLFSDIGAGGVRLGNNAGGVGPAATPHDILLFNSNISDGGHVVESGPGVLLQQIYNVTVEHCDVHTMYYTGVSAGWTWTYVATSNQGIRILNNRIFDIGRGRLSDMGCVYTLGYSPNSYIDGNVCHDVQSYGYGGNGLYTDQASTGYTFTNNIVYRTKSALLLQHFGLNNVFLNNVFADPFQAEPTVDDPNPGVFAGIHTAEAPSGWEGLSSFVFQGNVVLLTNRSAALMATSYPEAFRNMTFMGNCYWNSQVAPEDVEFATGESNTTFVAWQAMGKDSGSLLADPKFVPASDPRRVYNSLEPNSACLKVFKPIDSSAAGSFRSLN
jgi:hypothetical protein